MKYIKIILTVLLMSSVCWGATYYVDVDASPGGDGGYGSKWDRLSLIGDTDGDGDVDGDDTDLTGGDIVRIDDDTYEGDANVLNITWSGSEGNPIIFRCYTAGGLFNIHQHTKAAADSDYTDSCVNIEDVNYIQLQDCNMNGSGYRAACHIGEDAGTAGYSVKLYNCHVARNYNENDVNDNWDGFSLYQNAQAEFYYISADNCREGDGATEGPASTQAITFHTSAKGRVFGSRFTNSNNGYAGTENTEAYFYNCYFAGCEHGVIASGDNATANYKCILANCLINSLDGSKVFSLSTGVHDDAYLELNSCQITYGWTGASSTSYQNGTTVLKNCDLMISSDTWSMTANDGTLQFIDSRIGLGNQAKCLTCASTGNADIQIDGCTFYGYSFYPHYSYRYFIDFGNSAGNSYIKNSTFYNMNGYTSLVLVDGGEPSVDFENNTVIDFVRNDVWFPSARVGDYYNVNGAATSDEMQIKNNILVNVENVLDDTRGATDANDNCLYNSETFGGNQITSDPCFADQAYDVMNLSGSTTDFLARIADSNGVALKDNSPCKNAGSDGNSIGSYQFPSACSDLNRDGIVDLVDFAIFSSQWLKGIDP